MPYRILADLVLVLHLVFIVFAVGGALGVLRWPRLAWIHAPAAAWAATVVTLGWICPLTPIENALRRPAGEGAYAGGFIEQYLMPLVYPAGLTREIQIALGAVVVVTNGALYALVWRRHRRERTRGIGLDTGDGSRSASPPG